jgi:hypothetical protein
MTANRSQPRASTVEQVLVIDRSPRSTAALALELNRRGVIVATVEDLAAGTLLTRTVAYRAVILGPELDAEMVGFAAAVVRAVAIGAPTLMLLATPDTGPLLGRALGHADELMLADLPPSRIADALGIPCEPAFAAEWAAHRAA